jgi:hypothetical protein
MIDNDFTATMTSEELVLGEARHCDAEPSRRLAMAAGLTKSSQFLIEEVVLKREIGQHQ